MRNILCTKKSSYRLIPKNIMLKYDFPISHFTSKSVSQDTLVANNKHTDSSHPSTTTTTRQPYSSSPSSFEGYMYVQNRSFWRLPKHAWKKKYVVLRDNVLYISECKNDTVYDQDYIRIDLDTGIYPLDHMETGGGGVMVGDGGLGSGQHRYFIRITSGKHTVCALCSHNEDERDAWVTSLLTSISNALLGFNCSVRKRAATTTGFNVRNEN